MPRRHSYLVKVTWTGNTGTGTSGYRDYERSHDLSADGKPTIAGSSDPAFRGERNRWSPEDLLVGSVAACHKLWYLHLCADAGVTVIAYVDQAEGVMEEDPDGGGHFVQIMLRPHVNIARESDPQQALALHGEAHSKCFIARSLNLPVRCEPVVQVED